MLVEAVEEVLGGGLMGEGLDHLQTLNGLLDVAVHRAQVGLLLAVEPPGPAAEDLEDREGGPQGEHRHQEEEGAHREHDHHDAHEHQDAGEEGDHALLQGQLHVVGVVGEAAHELPVGVLVKVGEGQGLEVVEKLLAHAVGAPLGQLDHDARLAVGTHPAHGVDAQELEDVGQEPGGGGVDAPGDVVDDDQVDEAGAGDVGEHRPQQAHQDDEQRPLLPGQVAHEAGNGLAQVLGLLEAAPGAGTAGTSAAGAGHAVLILLGHYSCTPSC